MNVQQTELYNRFKELVKNVVDMRRPHGSDAENKEGLVGAYDNPEYFVQWVESRFADPDATYHDWGGFAKWLQEREEGQREDSALIDREIRRLKRESFSYLDIEKLRYEFPGPEDDTPEGFAR